MGRTKEIPVQDIVKAFIKSLNDNDIDLLEYNYINPVIANRLMFEASIKIMERGPTKRAFAVLIREYNRYYRMHIPMIPDSEEFVCELRVDGELFQHQTMTQKEYLKRKENIIGDAEIIKLISIKEIKQYLLGSGCV